VSTTGTSDRFTTLPDDHTLAATVVALEEHGFSVGVGAQKLVPDLRIAHERIYQHSLKLDDAGAYGAYGPHSSVGNVPEIHQESPGRIHVVLIRQPVGF
jgi:hypothetical protein